MTFACYACHGLGVVQPIDLLAAELNRETPEGVHFNTVGAFNPPLEETEISRQIAHDIANGREIIWIGHSMGAALGYYLPQTHPTWRFALVITVDPMSWASNIDCAEWATSPPPPGHWQAKGNFGRWISIHTSQYPGGGVLVNPGPAAEDHAFPNNDHIGVILDPRVKKIIFDAVLQTVKET